MSPLFITGELWLSDPLVRTALSQLNSVVAGHREHHVAKQDYMDNMAFWVYRHPHTWYKVLMVSICMTSNTFAIIVSS